MNRSAFSRIMMILLLLWPLAVQSGNHEKLNHLEGYKITTYYSDGTEAQAKEMASLCENAMAYYQSHLEFDPVVTLLVLSPADWSDYTDFPVYGMPHYTSNSTLVVAAEDNDLWRSFIPPSDQLPANLARSITDTYSDQNGNLSMRPFFDLLVIHELGHAYHFQAGTNMQRLWLMEVFVNIFLHTYIAEKEPELLPALTIFPKMVVESTEKQNLQFTTLQEMEENYNEIGSLHPVNYGWYQCRWHVASGKVYDEGGLEALKRLWFGLNSKEEVLDDEALIVFLSEKVHKSLAEIPLKWDD
jgi:hypothetical protein